MLLEYQKRLLKMVVRDPLKISSMFRLKFTKIDNWKKNFNSNGRVKVKPPIVVSIRPTQGCNLRCVMCPQWGENGVFLRKPDLAKRTVTTDEIKVLIDDVTAFKPYIYFSGGEPLMNKDILELIEYASSKHLVTSINTNGSYLYEKAEGLIKAGLDYLYTSLDAPTLTNDKIRKDLRGGGSYTDVVSGIKHVLKLRDEIGGGLPIVETKTTLIKDNQDQLLDMAYFVQDELKADIWALGLCVYTTPGLNDATSKVFNEEFDQDQIHWSGFIMDFQDIDFNKINKQLEIIKSKKWKFKLKLGKPLGMPGFDLRTYYLSPDKFATTEPLTCMNPYVFAQIQPNGEIAFCGSQPDYTIGNIKGNKFMDLWNNQKAAKWRKYLQDQLFPSCKRCWSLHEFQHFKN